MKKLFLATIIASAVLAISPVRAAEKNIGFFESWSVWQYSDAEGKGCFIYSNPSKAEPAKLNHGLVSFFVRSTGKSPPGTEASLQFGYDLDENAASSVDVDGKKVVRYLQPLYVARPCLACHGDPKGERDVSGRAKEGYREGELRGAVSVVVPVSG